MAWRRRRRAVAVALLAAIHLTVMITFASVALRGERPTPRAPPPAHHVPLDASHHLGRKGFGFGGARVGVGGARAKYRVRWCGPLRPLQPPRTAVTALASFPGSGNTWLRYLLQQATGVYTGSVYKDYSLMKNGFPAESVVNGSMLAVKTHEWGPNARAPFGMAVILMRSPKDAIQAEFNRQSGGHIGFAGPDHYKQIWKNFFGQKLRGWRQFHLDWLGNFSGIAHVYRYEDLVKDVERSLRVVLRFLEHPVDEGLMRCALERKEGIYRRKKRPLNFNPFTSSMEKELRSAEVEVSKAIDRYRSSRSRL